MSAAVENSHKAHIVQCAAQGCKEDVLTRSPRGYVLCPDCRRLARLATQTASKKRNRRDYNARRSELRRMKRKAEPAYKRPEVFPGYVPMHVDRPPERHPQLGGHSITDLAPWSSWIDWRNE